MPRSDLACPTAAQVVGRGRARGGQQCDRLVGFAGFAAAILAVSPADAQQTIKIGLILPYSGQFADPGAQADNGIKLYMQQHGDTVAGKKIEIVRKDTGGIAPDVAKRLAQELVVRDKVDLLAGFSLTPNALAAADVSAQAKKFMVVMNAAASIVTDQVALHGARIRSRCRSSTSRLASGPTRTACGRSIPSWRISRPAMTPKRPSRAHSKRRAERSSARCGIPVVNPDFSAFVQRAKDMNPEAIFIFVPGGSQSPAIAKALADRGIDPRKIKIMAQAELTDEQALKNMGDTALGIITSAHYDYNHGFEAEQGIRGRVQRRVQAQPGFLRRGRL